MWAQAGPGNEAMTAENANAHRSTLAPSSQAAYDLYQSETVKHYSVTFVMLSESGASMANGLFGPGTGEENPSQQVPAQLTELKQILDGRRPDIITVSIGGNDLGFGPDLQKLVEAGTVFDGFESLQNVENAVLAS